MSRRDDIYDALTVTASLLGLVMELTGAVQRALSVIAQSQESGQPISEDEIEQARLASEDALDELDAAVERLEQRRKG